MLALRDDLNYEDSSVKTCNIMVALDAVMQIQKKKVIVGPNDSVGVMFFNIVMSIPLSPAAIYSLLSFTCRIVRMMGLSKALKSSGGISYSSQFPLSVPQRSRNSSNY